MGWIPHLAKNSLHSLNFTHQYSSQLYSSSKEIRLFVKEALMNLIEEHLVDKCWNKWKMWWEWDQVKWRNTLSYFSWCQRKGEYQLHKFFRAEETLLLLIFIDKILIECIQLSTCNTVLSSWYVIYRFGSTVHIECIYYYSRTCSFDDGGEHRTVFHQMYWVVERRDWK
jgi:hypothetical protein